MEQQDRNRKIAIVVLAIFTLVLGGIAVIIGLRLQVPDDGFVSGGTKLECAACGAESECAGTCCACGICGGTNYTCNQICNQNACNAQSSTTSSAGPCQWSYANNGTCIQVTSGTCNIQTFTGSVCPTVENNQGVVARGPGVYCPGAQPGQCMQIDVVGTGQGVCSCTAGTTTSATTTSGRTTVATTTVATTTSASTPAPQLPKTALISDDVDRVLIAIGVLIFGYLAVRFRLLDSLFIELSQSGKGRVNRADKSRDDYERKFRDKGN